MSSSDLDESLQRLGKTLQERELAKVYQFPLWPEPKRGVPNYIVRSALFAARKKIVASEALRDEVIFSQGDIEIKYTGQRLTQAHLDVYEGVMHLAREQQEGKKIHFTAHGLLKLIGRRTGGQDRKRLFLTLTDLTATSINIRHKSGKVYWGSLLPEGHHDEETGLYSISLNRDLIKFFESGYTLIELEQRHALARSPLAQHLHGWILSHNKPFPVTVAFLKDLSGSDTKELKKFRQNLKAALQKLVYIGVIQSWEIDHLDKVHVVKSSRGSTLT